MRAKGILLIIIIIVALLGITAGTYIYFSNPEYKNITMSDIVFEVPESNSNVTNQTEHYSIYNDTEHGIYIYVLDSEGSGLNDTTEIVGFAATRDANQVGAQLQQNNNFSYNYTNTLKQYTYLTNYTHKNVFIVTKNKEDMEHILSSINTSSIKPSNKTNTTNNTTTTTKTTKKKSSSDSSKSEYGDYINGEYVSMSEEEYANRYPVLYHEDSLKKGKYDKYHPDMYEVDRENGYI